LGYCKWGADRRKEGRMEKQERERKKRKKQEGKKNKYIIISKNIRYLKLIYIT
jgi:hypothetical protein